MKIEVMGSGGPTWRKLYELTKKGATKIGSRIKVEYLGGDEGMKRIIELGAMGSPVIAVNDDIAITGFTPDTTKIKAAILRTLKK